MPTMWMMIGAPGVGKSTWISTQNYNWDITALISSDAIIDRQAAIQGKTYSEIFKNVIKDATAQMNKNLNNAIDNNTDIVWDQTNISVKTRCSKLSQIPANYHKVAVFFQTPDNVELQRRLSNRPGKTIPYDIVCNMISSLEIPSESEGFDEIITVC